MWRLDFLAMVASSGEPHRMRKLLWLGCGFLLSCGALPTQERSSASVPPTASASAEIDAPPEARSPIDGTATPVLGDHLRVALPASATVSPRAHSIMAAPEADETETRVILEQGDREGVARFVMLVSELHLLSSGNVLSDASKLAGQGEVAKPLEGGKLPMAELVVPTASDGPIPVLASILAHPDGTLQQAVFYVLPDLAKEQSGYRARALSIAQTFVAGARKSSQGGGPTSLELGLVVDLPPGFVSVVQHGPDFDVHRLTKLRKPGAPTTSLGFYFGGHPSLQFTQYARQASTPPTKKSEPGTLLGKSTTWENWTTGEGSLVREAIVPVGDGLFLHVFAFVPDAAGVAEVTSILRTLRRK